MQALWSLGDHGDLNAFTLYGLALLMEGKGWYDLEEGRLALENAAEDGCAMAQFYLGRFYLEAREDHDANPVMGRYWLRKATENGYAAAAAYLRKKWAPETGIRRRPCLDRRASNHRLQPHDEDGTRDSNLIPSSNDSYIYDFLNLGFRIALRIVYL